MVHCLLSIHAPLGPGCTALRSALMLQSECAWKGRDEGGTKRDPMTCNDVRAETELSFCIPETPLRGSEGCHGDDGFHPAGYLSQPRSPRPHLALPGHPPTDEESQRAETSDSASPWKKMPGSPTSPDTLLQPL